MQDHAGHRSTHLIGERRHRPGFPPFPSARSSDELPPSATCLVGDPSAVDVRAPHLTHGSATAGHAVTHARRAVTTPVHACAPRAVPAGRPWAGSTSGPRAPLCRGHRLGHASLCVGHWAEFRPVAFDLFFYFLNIFKYLQIQNFV
jgi:hypothetical protein